MGASSFVRRAKEEIIDGKTVTTKVSYKKDINGQMVRFTEYVEDSDNRSVSKRAVEDPALLTAIDTRATAAAQVVLNADSALLVSDLSSQITPEGVGPYTLPSVMKPNTLAVYLNGQMINDECVVANNAFTISADFAEAIQTDSSLFAIYVEQI
jgi:hypothetical protein